MTKHDKWGVDLSTLTQEEFDEWMTSECDSGTGTQEPGGGGVTKRVLGLDLSKVGLGQALETMAEAWLDAQGVELAGEAIAAPAVAASVPASKRSDWINRGWFVAPETAKRLKAYVNRAQEAGRKLDASEVVNEAIRQWLEAQS